jgi:cytochrome P450
MNLFAANRDPNAFDRPHEYLPERWTDGRKGRTDLPGEGAGKTGVPHLTYGAGCRVCPGIGNRSHPVLSVLH